MLQKSGRRAPFVESDSAPIYFLDNAEDIEVFARSAHDYLHFITDGTRKSVYQYFCDNSSFERVILPKMKRFFELLQQYKPYEKEKVYGELRRNLQG